MNCPFCNPKNSEIVTSNELCYARADLYPVNPGHLLVIPYRHVGSWFDMTHEEAEAVNELIIRCRAILDDTRHPDGYNIGVNVGEAAGQTVMHLHVHIIPRYKGDMEDPRGGVRGVIPEKRVYPQKQPEQKVLK